MHFFLLQSGSFFSSKKNAHYTNMWMQTAFFFQRIRFLFSTNAHPSASFFSTKRNALLNLFFKEKKWKKCAQKKSGKREKNQYVFFPQKKICWILMWRKKEALKAQRDAKNKNIPFFLQSRKKELSCQFIKNQKRF